LPDRAEFFARGIVTKRAETTVPASEAVATGSVSVSAESPVGEANAPLAKKTFWLIMA
jgi:hypothetical protein